jgi:predicted AAA+ superfamily ATPase
VIFTSSVALKMIDSMYDLSRRVKLVTLFPFSFREYVFFKKGESLPALGLEQIHDRKWDPGHMRQSHLFEAYLHGGLTPMSLEESDIFPLLENILEKIIMRDIPSVSNLTIDELDIIGKMVRFVGRSEVDGINYSCLSRNLGITKYKAIAYVDLLEKTFILNRVMPRGTNVLKEPKILMALPYRLLYRDYEEAVGGLREDFFVEMMRAAGIGHHYLKTARGTKTPDYMVPSQKGDLVVEIGGRGKGRTQFKGIKAERKLIFSHSDSVEGDRRPLFMLGFLL